MRFARALAEARRAHGPQEYYSHGQTPETGAVIHRPSKHAKSKQNSVNKHVKKGKK